jgi:hypothetical protein
MMSTLAEQIYQHSQQLAPDYAQEVLQFIEFMKFKQQQDETQYVLNNPHLMQQINAAEQSQWFTPQLNLDEE